MVRVLLGNRALNGVVEQFAVYILGGLIRGGNKGDVLAHDVGNHAGQQRVVGASEHERVDPGILEGLQVLASGLQQFGAGGNALLHKLHEARAGHRVHLKVGGNREGVLVGAGGDGRLRRNHADLAVAGRGKRAAGSGLNHLDDGDAVLAGVTFAGVAQHGGGCGVAGDDEHLHAGVDELVHDAQCVGAHLCNFEGAVGAVRGVADVDDAFVGQLIHDGAGHGKAAYAGVEDADGCRGGGGYGFGASPGGAGTVGIGCVDAITHGSPTLQYRSFPRSMLTRVRGGFFPGGG